ncbi:hypothetical protein Ancab_025184, partial [Ancistrocladus abbreviatus]
GLLKGHLVTTLTRLRQEGQHPPNRIRICALIPPTPTLPPPAPTLIVASPSFAHMIPSLPPSTPSSAIHAPSTTPTALFLIPSTATPVQIPFTIGSLRLNRLIDEVELAEYINVSAKGDATNTEAKIDDNSQKWRR